MDIDPQAAFARREHLGQTVYFCSQNCVDQFDADPHNYALAGSIATGFNPALPLARVELPLVGLQKTDRAQALEAALKAVPGVRATKVNVGSSVAFIVKPITRVIARLEEATDNLNDRLPVMLTESGFAQTEEIGYGVTLFGSMSFYRAVRRE
jgi:YHS domain-containing protein